MITRTVRLTVGAMAALLVTAATAWAAPISYTNISLNPANGITYRRGPSTTTAAFDAQKVKPFMSRLELFNTPLRPRGAPGVAVLDYDRDGDLDIYVANGPGRANSLYQNQLVPTGQFRFVDVGAAAGVAATDMDSTGVCYGDTDNDGDEDLMVLGRMEANRFFRNNGNGTFTDVTGTAGVAGSTAVVADGLSRGHTSCTMGDVNNDGLLDIFVANTFDWKKLDGIFNNSFGYNHPNDLYVNMGGNVFSDASNSSGVRNLFNVPTGNGTISWGTAMVDYDQDGDMDIMHADDQGAMAPSLFAGVDRGFIQLEKNDGTGHFTNVTASSGAIAHVSSWMGLSYGDFNCDGNMDFFATSAGDYLFGQMGIPTPPGLDSSRWHLGSPSGAFSAPDLGQLVVTPFGWGNGAADYDNDGDTDIIFFGSLNVGPFQTADNPGVILQNQGCTANFVWDQAATALNAERTARQEVMGLALGDLNDDGFVDIVTTSGQYVPPSIPLAPANVKWGQLIGLPFSLPFDTAAKFLPIFSNIGPLEWEWNGRAVDDGFLDVQISSAGNGNGWVKVGVKGTKGLTTNGKVNRDGIGAIVYFTPVGNSPRVMSPVLGGSSHMSEHSLVQGFGLGIKGQGTVDILWPGGVKNRLGGVKAGERVTIPEVPCDYSLSSWGTVDAFNACESAALAELVANGTITTQFSGRLATEATNAYLATH